MNQFKSSNKFQKTDRFGDIESDKISVAFGIINMASLSRDYNISDTGVSSSFLPQFMYIIPETSGVMVVELYGMDERTTYTISAAQVTTYLGTTLPFKVRKVVKSGTTATFSVAW